MCDNRATNVLMESDAAICVRPTLTRDMGEADGGLCLSVHDGSTYMASTCVRWSDVIKLWMSEVHQDTSSRHRILIDVLT